MKSFKEYLTPSIFMIAFLIVGSLYPLFNSDSRGVYSLVTEFDTALPFMKEFIIPYIAWYPFMAFGLLYFCIKDKDIYYKILISLIIGTLISYATFFVFQTHVPRPELTGSDLFTKLVSIIYANDKPYNCFPSLHVLQTYLIIKGIKVSTLKNKLNDFVITSTGTLIILSTQFIKQHVILDLVVSVILGEVLFRLVCKLDLEKTSDNIKAFLFPAFENEKNHEDVI